MPNFDVTAFIRKTADSAKTRVTGDDKVAVTLDGIPKAYTVAGLAKLAEETVESLGAVRGTFPVYGVGKRNAKSRFAYESPKKAAALIRSLCEDKADSGATAGDGAEKTPDAA